MRTSTSSIGARARVRSAASSLRVLIRSATLAGLVAATVQCDGSPIFFGSDDDCVLSCVGGCCGSTCPCDRADTRAGYSQAGKEREKSCSDTKHDCSKLERERCDYTKKYRAVWRDGGCVAELIPGPNPDYVPSSAPARIESGSEQCRECERRDGCTYLWNWNCLPATECHEVVRCERGCCSDAASVEDTLDATR